MALIQVNYIYIYTHILRGILENIAHHFPITFPSSHSHTFSVPRGPPVELRRPTELQGMYDAQSRCVGDLGGSPAGNCPRCTARWGPVVCWWSVRWPEARCRLCAQPETTHEDRGTGAGSPHLGSLWKIRSTCCENCPWLPGSVLEGPCLRYMSCLMLQEHVPIMCQFYLWSIGKRQLFGNFHTNRIMNHSVNCWHEQWGQKIPWQDTSSMEKFRTLNFSKFWTEKDECGMQNEEGMGMNAGSIVFRNI